jgi:hypothetical protein
MTDEVNKYIVIINTNTHKHILITHTFLHVTLINNLPINSTLRLSI